MSSLAQLIISHNDDASIMAGIMSVALLSLFAAFFFVTLLHCYARLFLARGGERPAPPVLVVPPMVVGAHRFLILHLLNQNMDIMSDEPLATKGLEPRDLSSIPVFIHDGGERGDDGLECVICLSLFEGGEKGRRLALCGHAFHIGCIDMWLQSHTTCPVCRAPAACLSQDPNAVVLGPVSEQREIDVVERRAGSDESRLSCESSRELEIVVEVPTSEGGSHATRKDFLSSNSVD